MQVEGNGTCSSTNELMPIFLADYLCENKPDGVPSLIAQGLLPESGRLELLGETGIGKSILAMDLCFSLAMKEPIFGARRPDGEPIWAVNRECKVLYLDAEVGPWGNHLRLQHFYRNRAEGIELGENFKIITGAYSFLSLSHQKGLKNMEELIKAEAPDVMVIDPIADYHGEDENSSAMLTVWTALRKLQDQYKFASILVHHETDKPNYDSQGRIIKRQGTGRSRGFSGTAQVMDTIMAFRRERSRTPYAFYELKWEKVRHQGKPRDGLLFIDTSRMFIQWVGFAHECGTSLKSDYMKKYKEKFPLEVKEDGDDKADA